MWKEAQEAERKGRPQSAIEVLEKIRSDAIARQAWPEALKATSRRIMLEGQIEGNKPEEVLFRLEREYADAQPKLKPLLQTLVALAYYNYFVSNEYRFMERSRTSEAPGDDLQSWDLARILAKIDEEFQKALADRATLKATPVEEFDGFLDKGTIPDSYRPTLFDFIAFQALAFYTRGEQAGAKPQDDFALSADDPIFDSVDAFLAWKPHAAEERAPTLRAIRLYQELLAFHQGDKTPDAFVDADLSRLQFGDIAAFGETKRARYQAALERFVEERQAHPISALALSALASLAREDGDLVKAHELAKRGLDAFPKTRGGDECFNLIQQIEAKSIGLDTERVAPVASPHFELSYVNLTEMHFRVVASDIENRLRRSSWDVESLGSREYEALIEKTPVVAWKLTLPATGDFQIRKQEIAVPRTLEPGFYYLIASHRADFGDDDNIVQYSPFWVSDLALVRREDDGSRTIGGFLLDATSGDPIPGGVVEVWGQDRGRKFARLGTCTTDNNGMFEYRGQRFVTCVLLARAREQTLLSPRAFRLRDDKSEDTPNRRTYFFTDRALYRPGQTIQYKGIVALIDRAKNEYNATPKANVTVELVDANGEVITTQKQTTNDAGSFSGSFTAPRDRLMGTMSIRTSNRNGATQFNVEEYKRPKFQVEVAAPKDAVNLGSTVSVTGTATFYTGAAVDGAKVRWRVVREVNLPPWWRIRCWWFPAPAGGSQEIAHGTTETNSDGTFTVSFVARPDLTVPKEGDPAFRFTVNADVTDTAGETRSDAEQVTIGYTSLRAAPTADVWQTTEQAVAIKLRTETLDEVGQAAQGTIKIHRLIEPEKVHRPPLREENRVYRLFRARAIGKPAPDLSNPDSWKLGDVVFESAWSTSESGTTAISAKLPAGAYRAVIESQDASGNPVSALLPIQVLDESAKKLETKAPHLFIMRSGTVEPGAKFNAVWGSGYNHARAFVEVVHRERPLQAYWTSADVTQKGIEQAVTEELRGGFNIRVTQVSENRAHFTTQHVDVPWTNKDLKLTWEHFTSKLEPSQKETWSLKIAGSGAESVAAEMVAALYDESLDAMLPHDWMRTFDGEFYRDYDPVRSEFANLNFDWRHIHGGFRTASAGRGHSYRSLPFGRSFQRAGGYAFYSSRVMLGGAFSRGLVSEGPMTMAAPAPMAMAGAALMDGGAADVDSAGAMLQKVVGSGAAIPPKINLDQVSARANLNETAFFYPHLTSDGDGSVRIEFQMPEALTRWKFLAFAHDAKMRAGYITGSTVTAKDLMIQPNPPRFVREGDALEFSVKVLNQSDAPQQGKVRLTFADARTGDAVSDKLGLVGTEQAFAIPAKESRSFSWKINIPDGMGFLTYKAVGATEKLSDGEEGYLPVLPRRILVTESLPLPIRGAMEKLFKFEKLGASGASDTLRHEKLVVQMVSNPSWYAVMALPYLMEYPHECSEQVFNRLYANALASHIAKSDPKIRKVFDQWRGTKTLESPLEKNQDIKGVLVEETPWLREAKDETQARQNVGVLFDENRLTSEQARTARKLDSMQLVDGLWPWFPGGRGDRFITLYVVTGFGRLRHLGVTNVDISDAMEALAALDDWMEEEYLEIRRQSKNRNDNHLNSTICLYLYGRSFFLNDRKVEQREALDYWLGQARKYWLSQPRLSQAHLAIGLQRFGDKETPHDIMISIREHAVTNEEMGMFWRDTEYSWSWYRAPIETQAIMIEAFAEVAKDEKAVEDCKVWLLKQKQTQDWKTTKATADAIYALLLRGTDMLASDELVEVSLGGTKMEPKNVEAGTGFYEQRFAGPEVTAGMSEIKVTKIDEGVAWGSVHWQYLEDMSKVTPHEGTPLTLKKSLWVKENTPKGPALKPAGGLKVGDELVVRIELRSDRDMEYLHMKDQRGSGTEPVNVLSEYKAQDGLRYYESTRDTASHFFIDYLPKGTYVFEYSSRVVHRGEYQSGVANIECMYAPEFNSHSESFRMTAR